MKIKALISTLLFAVFSYGFSAPCMAQFNPFSRLVNEHHEAKPRDASAQWFERADGQGRFVFDQSYLPGLIWDQNADEIWVVTPRRASGGGTVWVTDTGEIRLQFTHIGGVTYFPESEPNGVMVEQVGRAHTLAADPMDDEALRGVAEAVAQSVSSYRGETIILEVPPRGSLDNGYIAECVRVIEHALHTVDPRHLQNLDRIEIRYDLDPDVQVYEGALQVTIVPEMGFGGHPSSDRIAQIVRRQEI